MTDLEQIKSKVDIVDLVSQYVALKKTGANFKGLCPFHNEKTPSFVVSPERQIWHCFGACQDGGDIFKFLMRAENIEFPEALKILADRAGVKLTSYAPTQTTQLREKIFAVNHLAGEFYQYLLTTHPLGQPARDYLKNRAVTTDSIKLFGLGYAPGSWDSLTRFLTKKGYSPADLEAAGLVSRSGLGHFFDRFRGRVMFTLRDHRGNVVGFAGRLMDPEAKEAKYINTAETAVYTKGNVLFGLDVTKEEIKKEGAAVVVEGEIDAISSYQAGVRNVVAIKGSALTDGQVTLLKRYTENVLLSLDADYAGDAAAHRGILTADAAGLNIKVVTFKDAKDPDELIKKDPALWHQAVKNAVNFYDFVIDRAVAKYDANAPDQAKKIVEETAKFIAPIDNLVVKNHYLKKLAEKLNINEDDLDIQLDREMRKAQVGPAGKQESEKAGETNKTRMESLEEYLLALVLQAGQPADYLLLISHRLAPEDFPSPALGKIYSLMVSFIDNPKSDVGLPKFDIKTFAKVVPPELLETVDRLYLTDLKAILEDDATMVAEAQKAAWEIKELSLREKLKQISRQLSQSAEPADLEQNFAATTATLQKLLEEKSLLSGKT
ncbi:MAG: DNA primase [Patescibacteria group bacterium]|nr:DNA primase [Patescibacteria group bacterium]